MSRFMSLMHKEWIQFRVFIVATLIVCFAINIGLSIILQMTLYEKLPVTMTMFRMQDAIFTLTIIGSLFLFMAACYQLIRSISLDFRQKELWLHNAASIYTLVGVKLSFTLLWSVTATFIYTLTLQFLKPLFTEGLKVLFLQLCFSYFMFIMLVLVATVLLLAFAFHKYIRQYVRGFAWILSSLFVLGLVVLIGEMSESKVLASVVIKFEFVENWIPKVYSEILSFEGTGLGDVYVLSDLFLWVFIMIGFILACKWIEKVITR